MKKAENRQEQHSSIYTSIDQEDQETLDKHDAELLNEIQTKVS